MGKRKGGTFRSGDDVRGLPAAPSPIDELFFAVGKSMVASSYAIYLERHYKEQRRAITYDEGIKLATNLTRSERPYERRPGFRQEDGLSLLYDYQLVAEQARKSDMTAALVERSETEKLAWDALEQCIKWQRENQEPVTGALLEWALDVAEGTRERPRSGRDQTTKVRNALIAKTVKTLVACGMHKTRNDSSPSKSACDVVAKVLKMEYKAVVKACNRVVGQFHDTRI